MNMKKKKPKENKDSRKKQIARLNITHKILLFQLCQIVPHNTTGLFTGKALEKLQ